MAHGRLRLTYVTEQALCDHSNFDIDLLIYFLFLNIPNYFCFSSISPVLIKKKYKFQGILCLLHSPTNLTTG